ncbi:MAG: ABC transporter ATP-binding protein [Ectothiorhodospiraceae bacterium]|nr:ABC transporter ATP-binding protein [Ectothiorhodospiraceae bacterium]MCH8505017.1 ABC transporter ATP-binding protein [Ectothiorhodospiraceae bacterium]
MVGDRSDDILLELRRVDLDMEGTPVARALSFRVRRGQLVCLLGPSGCGKTTTLRSIAGFHPVASGEIELDGRVVSQPGYMLPPEKRGLGMVFQDHSLFPHLTVEQNICFGLKRMSAAAKHRRAEELLDLVSLAGLGDRYPDELSGGQQQRVALARALAPKPALVLMDEPFSSLDVDLRERLAAEVHEIFQAEGVTAVLVTHDQREAFAMADQVGVMRHGQIVQWDTPYNLYHEPVDRFVADFIGQGRFLRARLMDHETLETELGIIQGNRSYGWPTGTEVDLLLRPDDVQPDPESSLTGKVVKKAFTGAETLYTLELETGTRILSLFPSHHDHEIGEVVGIRIDAQHLVAFQRDVTEPAKASRPLPS